MKVVVFSSLIAFSFALYFTGRNLSQRKSKFITPLIVTCFAMCTFLIVICAYRVWLASLFPIEMAIFMEKGAFVPFAVMFFVLCSTEIHSRFVAKSLHWICWLLIGYQSIYCSWMITETIHCGTQKSVDGVFLQSTPSTCGPASLTTILQLQGINATEQEMTNLSHTTAMWGTTSLRMMKALHDKMMQESQDYSLSIRYATWNDLQNTTKPCIVDTKYSTYINHVMVLLSITNGRVVLGDPLEGKIYLTKNQFMKIWTTELIEFTVKKDR